MKQYGDRLILKIYLKVTYHSLDLFKSAYFHLIRIVLVELQFKNKFFHYNQKIKIKFLQCTRESLIFINVYTQQTQITFR